MAVVGERAFWWLRESRKRDPQKLEQMLAALENSDTAAARRIAAGSEDPVIRTIRHGLGHLGHTHKSMLGALQLAAGMELKNAPGGFSRSWTHWLRSRHCWDCSAP